MKKRFPARRSGAMPATDPRAFAALCCIALSIASFTAPAHAVMPAAWKTTNYALAPGEARVRDVLGDLQKTMGLSIEMTQAVQGTISSAGEATTVEGLLNKMAVNNGLNWFVFRNRLYVARESEVEEAHLPAPADQVAELRSYLSGLRLLEDKFGWVEMASRNEVTVIGPPGYIRLIRQHAASVKLVKPKVPAPVEPMQTMTFRLRHASAVDVPGTGGTAKITGVASLLARLYGGTGALDGSMSGGKTIVDTSNLLDRRQKRAAVEPNMESARIAAMAARRTPTATDSEGESAEPSIPAFPVRLRSLATDLGNPGSGSGSGSGAGFNSHAQARIDGLARSPGDFDEPPSIAADARLNMILVRDRASKRAEYEKLIADLDVATLQFGLNAVVLELDTDAMGVLLADIALAPRPGPLASSVIVSRSAVEALYPALRAARQCKQDISLVSQSIVFKENDSFGMNFADDLIYPTMSTPFWYSLLSQLVPLAQAQTNKARTIGLKLEGSARATGDRRVELRFELTDGRDNPLDSGELVSKRLTETRMSIDLTEDDVLLLVDGLAWSGNDMKTARSRLVMLSTHRWSREDAPRQLAAAAALAPSVGSGTPACAASASAKAPLPAPVRTSANVPAVAATPVASRAPAPTVAPAAAASAPTSASESASASKPAWALSRGAPVLPAPDVYAR